jgi:hypothetical protein
MQSHLRYFHYFTYKNILDKASIYLNSKQKQIKTQEIDDILSNPETFGNEEESNESGRIYIKHSLQELSELLDQAVQHED